MKKTLPKVVLTGASGKVGSFISAELLKRGYAIIAISKSQNAIDLADQRSVEKLFKLLSSEQPKLLIHAAGITPTPGADFSLNVRMAENLCSAIEPLKLPADFKLINIGSASEIGNIPDDCLYIHDDISPNPTSDYGKSKSIQAEVIFNAALRLNFIAINARIFNLTHLPGLPRTPFASWAAQIARVEKKLQLHSIEVGDLQISRDFLTPEEMACCIVDLASNETPQGTYNVASGIETRLTDALEAFRKCAKENFETVTIPSLIQTGAPRRVVANIEKLVASTKRRPIFDLNSCVKNLLDQARKNLA